MGLIGLPVNGLAFAPLVFNAPTFTDLLNSTLGNMGTSGDDLDLSSQALGLLMSAFEADVSSTDAADTIPDVTVKILDTGILDALAVEIAVASATETAVSASLDFLASTFGVWGVFDVLVQDIVDALFNLANWVISLFVAMFQQINLINPGFGNFGPG